MGRGVWCVDGGHLPDTDDEKEEEDCTVYASTNDSGRVDGSRPRSTSLASIGACDIKIRCVSVCPSSHGYVRPGVHACVCVSVSVRAHVRASFHVRACVCMGVHGCVRTSSA